MKHSLRLAPLVGLCAAFLLTACLPPPKKTAEPAPAGPTCTQSLVRTVGFTSPDAQDVVEVHALAAPAVTDKATSVDTTQGGALCHAAMTVFVLRHGEFRTVLHSAAQPIGAIEMVGEGHAGPPFTPQALATTLAAWADSVALSSTKNAPALEEGTVYSPLAPDAYEAMRKADRPMLCYAAGIHETTCLVADPEGLGDGAVFVTQVTL